MTTLSFYLDARRPDRQGNSPIKLCVTRGGQRAYVATGLKVTPQQWSIDTQQVVSHPNARAYNTSLLSARLTAERIILQIENSKESIVPLLTISEQIRQELTGKQARHIVGSFWKALADFTERKSNTGTRKVYTATQRRITAYMGDKARYLNFDDITPAWLTTFDNFMATTAHSRNARNIHLRNIRAVFNDAIDAEVTQCYPFRRFKIRPEATAKRSLTVDELRTIFAYEGDDVEQPYIDIFKLSFLLIGINIGDLCHLKEVRNGRVEYRRAKTGKLYSIKVEPEAQAIIDRYRGSNYLLDICDRYKSHLDYLHHINRVLRTFGGTTVGNRGKKSYHPIFPMLSTYWARHSWATVAAELDIPKETIAHALGHGGNTVTDIYIRFDDRKIDEANRRVIDFVLCKKKS
jgi:hypothetical protein